jgi:hypothetical protein
MPFEKFDRSKLELLPLEDRVHDLDLSVMLELDDLLPEYEHPNLTRIASKIAAAHQQNKPVIILMGAHVIRSGVVKFLVDLMERGIVTGIGGNGAVAIHDLEFSMIGKTTESVARYIQEGQFGLWKETGRVNDAAKMAVADGIGFGEAVGKLIVENPEEFPHQEYSLLAAGYQLQVPITLHIGIGQDITHEHPNFDGAAVGAASYEDFLIFARQIEDLEGGVMLNIGSAVMGPEIYLKALAMARNAARQEGREIRNFSTGVFDLIDLGDNPVQEAPKTDAIYYYRPYKTVLVRTVADGGESFYVQGSHRKTIPNLHRIILENL